MAVAFGWLAVEEEFYAILSSDERAFADRLLDLDPHYRYDRSGLPKLDPVPAAGLASAVAAAWIATGYVLPQLLDPAEYASDWSRDRKDQEEFRPFRDRSGR